MSKSKSLVPVRDRGLAAYLAEAQRYPILDPDEEYMLAKRWREHGDTQAARRLITSHLRLVAKIAMGFRGYGLPIEDIIAEGNVGLMKAVKRFDPERGFRLSTYAMWWIRASIQEYILRASSMVKLGTTAAQKKLFFNLRRLKNRIQATDHGPLTPEAAAEIADALDVDESEVIAMDQRLGGPDQSLNAPMRSDGEMEWQDRLVEPAENQETVVAEAEEMTKRRELLAEALDRLNDRERHIFVERCLKDPPSTLDQLSKIYGISRERVRQIEVRAFEKTREVMLQTAVARGLAEPKALPAAAGG